jgi:hypothetical protein
MIRTFLKQLQMHYRNYQNMVRYQISDLKVVDVLVAEFRESIMPAIPQMIALLGTWEASDIHKLVSNALSKLSEHGKISNFLT